MSSARLARYRSHVVRSNGIIYSGPRLLWYQFEAEYHRWVSFEKKVEECDIGKFVLEFEWLVEGQALLGSVDCMLPVSSATRALMRATRDSMAVLR